MGDGYWSRGTCEPQPAEEFWWYGVPGQGSWGWTARFGQYWIGGGSYQAWASQRHECGTLGVPVKAASGGFGAYWQGADEGQWFKGGATVRIYGTWTYRHGDYGQTAGRLVAEEPPPATEPGLLPEGEPPEITDEMRATMTDPEDEPESVEESATASES